MDPLAQLHDIQTPEPIGSFPLAIGWYILIVLAIVAVVAITRVIWLARKRRKQQKQAMLALAQTNNNQEVIEIIKWAALAYFPRQQVAKLYGHALFEFLSKTLPANKQSQFKSLAKNNFETLYQRNNQDDNSLQAAATFWLKHALPAKGVSDV
ncbi:DUF4381 domain-containing protein [Thalassotalea sp. LPB0316]|uniref:DUF4381 domain-containing protein n=1 Tax=Thalassotalea sp. LPB0316 TaxID=2769490 RepID=UPI0018670270|nr:DUF4381 domain-containing protein [Thalassotalea sp. LPB0316]QOL24441.1 DUF4381 domain-containing protein [Thalassotalea sp. LPB0316]